MWCSTGGGRVGKTTLINLDILEWEVPTTDQNPQKSKHGLNRINDNYIRSWLAFVYPNRSFIEIDHSGIVQNKICKSLVLNHTAFVYEDVCREQMWELNTADIQPFNFSRLDRYWESNTEIDIAALDPEGSNLILGECRYWQEPVGVSVLRDLEEKVKTINWKWETRKTWFVLFGCNGFAEELRGIVAGREDL